LLLSSSNDVFLFFEVFLFDEGDEVGEVEEAEEEDGVEEDDEGSEGSFCERVIESRFPLISFVFFVVEEEDEEEGVSSCKSDVEDGIKGTLLVIELSERDSLEESIFEDLIDGSLSVVVCFGKFVDIVFSGVVAFGVAFGVDEGVVGLLGGII